MLRQRKVKEALAEQENTVGMKDELVDEPAGVLHLDYAPTECWDFILD